MQNIFQLFSLVSNLSWDDSQQRESPSDFTNNSMHIALEKADMERKWDIFRKIMDKDSYTKIVLLHHIKNTVFNWNCKNEKFWCSQYKDLQWVFFNDKEYFKRYHEKRKIEKINKQIIAT